MKHEFVLDENILYLAVRGIDEKGEKDIKTSKLLLLILKNCHKVVIDKELNTRYEKHLKTLERISRKEPVIPGMENFVRNLLHNKGKVVWHFSPLDAVPGEDQIPRKDIHVVRTGYHFRARIITVDEELIKGIRSSGPIIKGGLVVLRPWEAISLAEET